MTVFLDTDGRPFFGGTYFPPTARHGMPSFVQLLDAITDAWANRRPELHDQADRLTSMLHSMGSIDVAGGPPAHGLVDAATQALAGDFDPEWGGFGGAPKFPASMNLDLLLRVHHRTGDANLLNMVTTSLDAMASGGMYDHLAGGFSRYSVDERWMVPHFEKMLYDNALLARVYLHSWQVTGDPDHRQVLEEIVDYVLRDLRHPDGGLYSAEDADSEGVEGKFYVFTPDEVRDVLGSDADDALIWWGITDDGNFEGSNIPWRPERGALVRPPAIEEARKALLGRRNQRIRPGLDDKVLTEWNALFLASLAEAALVTNDAGWLEAAETNGQFLLDNLRDPESGRWLRSWQAGDADRPASARHLAYAHDYAALVDAFTRLAEATGHARWIVEARATADAMLDLFWDDDGGGLFTSGRDAEALVTRPKDIQDNATPAANSVSALALLRLGALTGESEYRRRAETILSLVGPVAARHPSGFGHLLAALDLYHRGAVEVAITGDRPDLVRQAAAGFRPRMVLAWGEPYDSPLWADRRDDLAYVCHDFVCERPTDRADALAAQLHDA